MKTTIRFLDFKLFFPKNIGGFGKLSFVLISRAIGKLALSIFLLWAVATSPDEIVNLTLIFGLANIFGTTLALSSLLLSPQHFAEAVSAEHSVHQNNILGPTGSHAFANLTIASLIVVLIAVVVYFFVSLQTAAICCFFAIWLYLQVNLVGALSRLVGRGWWFFLSVVQLCPALSFSFMTLLSNFNVFSSPSLLFMLGILMGALFQVWLIHFRFNQAAISVQAQYSQENQLNHWQYKTPTIKQLIAITVPFCLFYFSDELVLLALDLDAKTIAPGLLYGKIFFALVVNLIFSSFHFFLRNILQHRQLDNGVGSLVLLIATAFIFSAMAVWATTWGGMFAEMPQIKFGWLYFGAFFSKALMSLAFVILILNSLVGVRAVPPAVFYIYPVSLTILIANADDNLSFVSTSLIGVVVYVTCIYRDLYMNTKPVK